MRKVTWLFFFALALQNTSATAEAQPTPTPTSVRQETEQGGGTVPLRAEVALKQTAPESFSVTVSAPREGDVLSISVNPPTIKANPASWKLPEADGKITRSFVLEPPAGKQLSGQIEVGAELTRPSQSGPGKSLAGTTFQFLYRRGIPLSSYFLWGILGIVLGYLLRLFIKVLSEVTPPQLAPVPGAPEPGPLKQFVQRYYFFIDCGVTAAIGFLALVALVQDGQPPQNASYWYTALAVGVGMGLLTNSELLTKLPR